MTKEELQRLDHIYDSIKAEAENECYYFSEEDVLLMERVITFLYGVS